MNMKICIDKKISNYHSKRNYYWFVKEERKYACACTLVHRPPLKDLARGIMPEDISHRFT